MSDDHPPPCPYCGHRYWSTPCATDPSKHLTCGNFEFMANSGSVGRIDVPPLDTLDQATRDALEIGEKIMREMGMK